MPLYMIGQNKIKYSYDDAGNRIKREIVLNTTRAVEVSTSVFTEELAQRGVKIYPNPTQGQLVIEISDVEKAKSSSLSVLNLKGQTVARVMVISNITNLDISSEPSGTYILQIRIDDVLSSWKIIKK